MEKNTGSLSIQIEDKAIQEASEFLKTSTLIYPELLKLLEFFKGKSLAAVIEAVLISVACLDSLYLKALINSLEDLVKAKVAKEVQEKLEKGEADISDIVKILAIISKN